MGLVKEGDRWAVLTDIAGEEDHHGDMDFKVAGTRTGITALQMDIKIGGITAEIMAQALEQARQGRLHILDRMAEALAAAAGRHQRLRTADHHHPVPVDKIRDIIGPGGKMIRSIVERTGCKIDVEDDGRGQHRLGGRGRGQEGGGHHRGADRHRGAEQDATWARSSGSSTSAPSWRSCPAPTGSSTSRRWPTTA